MNKISSIFFAFLLITSCQIIAAENNTSNKGLLRTTSGILQGQESEINSEIIVHRGIPFAKPPVGELRWRAPKPTEPWTGVRDATRFGAACWQPAGPATSIYRKGLANVGEDCLTLNVWSKGDGKKRPVMVWFHGGANSAGSGSSTLFDGTHLAEKNVVVVTVNYRLGPFGFFAHPELSVESGKGASGNYGLMDQIESLRWVQENIAAFGGDNTRVTIFGQSAGSTDVCLLMASPQAKNLFHRAIGFSAGCMKTQTPLTGVEGAELQGVKISRQLNITSEGEAALRALRKLSAEQFYKGAQLAGVPLASPIVDGWIIPNRPQTIFSEGKHNKVPFITGHMADEMKGLAMGAKELTKATYQQQLQQMFGSDASTIGDAYKVLAAGSTRNAINTIATDVSFAWESRKWAELVTAAGNNAFVYYFSHPTLVYKLYGQTNFDFPIEGGDRALGAYHSGDLAYTFNNTKLVGHDWTQWDHQLSDQISEYWVNFAHTGNPNGGGLPSWPIWQTSSDKVLEFGKKIQSIKNPRHQKLNLFDGIYSVKKNNN